jgi:hypothetical protein
MGDKLGASFFLKNHMGNTEGVEQEKRGVRGSYDDIKWKE